jgi:signal transduction histidine kinase
LRPLTGLRALTASLGVLASCAGVAGEPWRVVLLAGSDPALPAAAQQDNAFRAAVRAAAPDGVEFYTDSVDNLRLEGAELMPELVALLTKKYRQQRVDLVAVWGDLGLTFAERYHDQIWPGKPVLVYSVETQKLRERGIPPQFAYLPLDLDIDGTIAIAEALQPNAKKLVVIAGAGALDQSWARRAEAAAAARPHGWQIDTWSGVPLPELRERLAALDAKTAVLYTMMFRDRRGSTYMPYEIVRPMVRSSGAPIYSWYPNYFDQGTVAGSLMSHAAHGQRAGELAVQILRGERAADGATLPRPPSRCMGNVERIEALGLSVDALPPGCALANQPMSLWHEHRKGMILGLGVLLAQALTIAALLVQRHRRHAAEDDAARRRLELGRATRVAALGELSASIAHEVGQPLAAIVTNTQAAELILQSGHAGTAELEQVFADIRHDALRANEVVRRLRALLEKRAVEMTPIDATTAFEEALSLLLAEARRRGIAIERDFAAIALVQGDPIQLQQVLLNLALNAMDAMRETPPSTRVMSVSTHAADGGIELLVADRGHGLSAEAQSQLFESFFTTKPHGVGLGLSIVRSVVNAHGGRVWARARPGGGSIFTVWLPHAPVPVPSHFTTAAAVK